MSLSKLQDFGRRNLSYIYNYFATYIKYFIRQHQVFGKKILVFFQFLAFTVMLFVNIQFFGNKYSNCDKTYLYPKLRYNKQIVRF